jgi:hypothetical protein
MRTIVLRFATMLLLFAALPLSAQIDEHYKGKTVQVLMPIPKNIPLAVFDRDDSPFNVDLMKLKFERSGMGLDAGIYAVITDVDINGKEIRFRLVGTGEVAPPSGTPVEVFDPEVWNWGSGTVAVAMREDVNSLSEPITAINKVLARVVTTRELLSSEGLPDHFREAIRKKEVMRGMSQKAVYMVLGAPDEVLRELEADSIREAWLYRNEDLSTVSIFFRDGIVFLIKTY